MKFLKQIKSAVVVINIAMILFGIVLVAFPMITLWLLCWIVGACAVIAGISNIIGYFSKYDVEHFYRMGLASGILLCILGIFLMTRSYLAVDILVIVLGLLVFIKNVVHLPGVFELRAAGEKKWWIPFILNLISCLLGIAMFVVPIGAARVVVILVGIAFIVDGVTDLIWTLKFSKRIKMAFKERKMTSRYIDTTAEEKKDDD